MICNATVRERGRRRAAVAGALLATLPVVAACGRGSDKAVPAATVPTAPAHTITTDPYAVPAVIDAAYVNRVITGLDALKGDVTRLVLTTRTIPREAFDRLKAMYAYDNGVDRELDGYSRDLSRGLAGYKDNPGNKVSAVKELITASDKCAYVRVERDYSPVGVDSPKAVTEWIALRPLDRTRDPNGYNVTGWVYLYEGYTAQRTQPEQNPCNA